MERTIIPSHFLYSTVLSFSLPTSAVFPIPGKVSFDRCHPLYHPTTPSSLLLLVKHVFSFTYRFKIFPLPVNVPLFLSIFCGQDRTSPTPFCHVLPFPLYSFFHPRSSSSARNLLSPFSCRSRYSLLFQVKTPLPTKTPLPAS